MNRETELQTALALQVVTGITGALARYRRTGRPTRFDLAEGNHCGTLADFEEPPRPGYEPVWVTTPEEDLVGLAKRLYTTRMQGGAIPAGVLRVFAEHLAPRGDRPLKFESDQELADHLNAGPIAPRAAAAAPAPPFEPNPPPPKRPLPPAPALKPAAAAKPAQKTFF